MNINNDDTNDFKKYIAGTYPQFVQPIETIAWLSWKAGQDIPNGKHIISLSFFVLAGWLTNIDKEISDSELNLYRDVVAVIEPQDYTVKTEDILGYSGKISQDRSNVHKLQEPFAVSFLTMYDKIYGTNLAGKARIMFFRFANAFVKVDGRITSEEETALKQFKMVLFPTTVPSEVLKEEAETKSFQVSQQIKNVYSVDELLMELNSLIGLDAVKNDIAQLVDFLKVQKIREERGMSAPVMSRHLVFYGNPGTGKTTVARLIAKIYKSLNVVTSGHLVETDRSGLVAGYVGQTALKVKEVVEKAKGGVLFIDEAYSLVGDGQDYGREAIDTLIKLMEDDRDNLVVIVAGYTEKMRRFIYSNPGLSSRFNKFFSFEDYTPSQLQSIFKVFCKDGGFELSSDAEQKVLQAFQELYDQRDENFGNARLARNLFQETINKQASRIVSIRQISDDVLSTIEAIDIAAEIENEQILIEDTHKG